MSAAGDRVALFEADVHNDGANDNLTVIAEPHLVMDGGATGTDGLPIDFDATARQLTLGALSGEGNRIVVGREGGLLSCQIPVPSDAAVGVRFRFVEGQEDE